MGAGAAEAEASCPKTSDPSKLPDKMSTRRFIDSQLQVSLVKAVKALHQHRPGPGQVQNFLLKALQGEPLPSVGEKVDADTRIYDYLKQNGAFALLKPALLAVDRVCRMTICCDRWRIAERTLCAASARQSPALHCDLHERRLRKSVKRKIVLVKILISTRISPNRKSPG